ncbi:hypothetical protein [Dickeya sp. ws52]|uniref:hypothetical protein n=1 Tax=Dickeya sp. ws52 TaxID=2576377 RepID=UPI001180E357|nr:hypothetical protein [Dickeya sp. ws52]TYL43979.1 hypothetical protein FDP13_04055 [Dickeya sp. ws52]
MIKNCLIDLTATYISYNKNIISLILKYFYRFAFIPKIIPVAGQNALCVEQRSESLSTYPRQCLGGATMLSGAELNAACCGSARAKAE